MPVYLDYNASAPFPKGLSGELESLISQYGNPASLHSSGRSARRLINQATENAAAFLDIDAEFIYWTSGASEANSWAVHSAVEYARSKNLKPRLLISAIEHESVQLAAKFHEACGAELKIIPVTKNGVIDLEWLKNLLATDANWSLISVMHANNETGVVQPVEQVVAAAKAHLIPTHVDCVQTLGKMPLSVRKIGATYTTFSAHKVGGLKGTGILAIQGTGKILTPLIHGKQQKSLRGGTENPVGVAAFGSVLMQLKKTAGFATSLTMMRNDFEAKLKKLIPGTIIHGEGTSRLYNTTFVGFEGADGDGILMGLDLEGVCASSGSACTSGSIDPSTVLLAMECDKAIARSSVRFSSGPTTTWADYEQVLKVLVDIVARVRK